MDTAVWQALTLVLTVLGLGLSFVLWRRRGVTAGLRGVAWSLLPLAAYLTGTLRLLWEIADAVSSWALRLVLSPLVWAGIVLAGVSVLLFLVTGVLRRRGVGMSPARRNAAGRAVGRASAGSGRPAVSSDDDLAEIADILKKHGIS